MSEHIGAIGHIGKHVVVGGTYGVIKRVSDDELHIAVEPVGWLHVKLGEAVVREVPSKEELSELRANALPPAIVEAVRAYRNLMREVIVNGHEYLYDDMCAAEIALEKAIEADAKGGDK